MSKRAKTVVWHEHPLDLIGKVVRVEVTRPVGPLSGGRGKYTRTIHTGRVAAIYEDRGTAVDRDEPDRYEMPDVDFDGSEWGAVRIGFVDRDSVTFDADGDAARLTWIEED